MAIFTLSLTSNVITGSKSYNLSDEDVTRWINALKVSVEGGAGKSNTQLLVTWADEIMSTLKRHVLNVESQAAAVAAANSVIEIVIT